MSAVKLALFDVDGTLVDSQALIRQSMTRAFQSVNQPVPANILSIVGLSLPQAVFKLAPDLDAATRDQVVEAYKQSYFELRAGGAPSPLYDGAMEVISQLAGRDDVLLGVATGKSRSGLDHMLEAFDLNRIFVTQQCADNHPSKPHPSMVLTALAETGVEARDAIMIGDTSFDMEMGRAAGAKTLGVTWGYHGVDALIQAHRVVTEYTQMSDALNELWADKA